MLEKTIFNKGKITLTVLISFTLLMISVVVKPPTVLAAGDNIKVILNNKAISLDSEPVLKDSRLLVPFRAIFDALGATVEWDDRQRVVKAVKDDIVMFLHVGDHYALINDKKVYMEVVPIVLYNRLYIPLRFVSDNMGQKCVWDQASRTVTITSPTVAKPQSDQPAKTITLDKDTELEYSTGNKALFKAGTPAVINGKGLIESGTIVNDTLLPYYGKNNILLQGGTKVEFTKDGTISQGVLKNEVELNRAKGQPVWFAAGQVIKFRSDGYVKSGILLWDTQLPYCDRLITSFRGRSEVEFNDQGHVIRGTLMDNTSLRFSLNYLSNGEPSPQGERSAVFERDTVIEFYERGQVKKGQLLEDTSLPWAQAKEGLFREHTSVTFFPDGTVQRGIFKEREVINTALGKSLPLLKETVVEFFPGGILKQGVLATDMYWTDSNGNQKILRSGETIIFDDKGNLQ